MHIVHIASELAPLAKVGGLADVLLGLSRELSWKGHDIDIIIPKYDCMDSQAIRDFAVDTKELPSFYKEEWHNNTVWIGWVENLKVFFIEPHHFRYFFNRGCFYGCDDDIERYLYFSRAALEFMQKRGLDPDIIHIHDWQTAAIAPLYNLLFKTGKFTKSKLVFTIHNLEYQGKCAPFNLDWIGLPGQKMLASDSMRDLLYPSSINLIKGAIVYADYITTVSPNYAWEVKTPEGGRGLDPVIVHYQDKFCGILNGIDYSYWNPEIDRYLPVHFSPREIPGSKKDRNTLDQKAYIKKVLRERLCLSDGHRPIIGCISRLVPQKGIDMIKHVILTIADKGGQFVLLGSSPIPSVSEMFHDLKHAFTDHPHIGITLQHQEELAHLIFAGSDIFIVPSLFEPCGLTQLIAMKYGTIPVVRRTGGLADTVFDVDYSGLPFEESNGYTFDHPDNQGIDSAVDRAIRCWYDQPDRWRKLMINAMGWDFSWNKSSDAYLEIYKKVMLQ
jgi:starch synthase